MAWFRKVCDFFITINSHILKWKFSRGLTRKNCENKTTAKITMYTVFVPITWVLFYLIVWLLEAPARHPPSHQWQKLSDNAPSPQLLWDCTSTISPPPLLWGLLAKSTFVSRYIWHSFFIILDNCYFYLLWRYYLLIWKPGSIFIETYCESLSIVIIKIS